MNDRWDLEPIYKGFEDPAFEEDLKKLGNLVEEMKTLSQGLEAAEPVEALVEGIRIQEELTDLVGRLTAYPSLRQAANTGDDEAASAMGRIRGFTATQPAPELLFRIGRENCQTCRSWSAATNSCGPMATILRSWPNPDSICCRTAVRRSWPG